jgi:broad specificity phosphatase PhoE
MDETTSQPHRLTLVRHGETVGQSSIRYYGSTDVALSELGITQMTRVRQALAAERFDAVLTSALCRTVEAARIIAPNLEAQAVAGFNEICFGDWEGLTREEIAARDPRGYAAWRSSLHEFTYPNGDCVSVFRSRVAETFQTLLPALPANVLIIVHRGIVSTILTELLQLTPDQRTALGIELASIHTVSRNGRAWQAEQLNRIDHLEGLP